MGENIRCISIVEDMEEHDFLSEIYPMRQPVVLRGMHIGSCIEKWNPHYLSEVLGDQDVKIHVCHSPLMDFVGKNFLYRSLPFSEFIKRASENEHTDYFTSKRELYYMRSIGKNPRKDVADIRKQFPVLSEDIIFPNIFPENKFFSSVFRIASAGMCLWTHYDIMDNILMQIKGRKRAVLFPPEDSLNLYLNGDKSEVLDIDNPDLVKYPNFSKVQRYECYLEPNDILFIPALWFHNMKSMDFGVAVNVFWRHLDEDFYDKKDPYGNKDLLLAQSAFNMIEKSLKTLEQLPESYKKFYYRRLIAQIQKKI